jgi:membrane protein required for colicin V production
MSVFDLIILTVLIALAFRGWITGMIAQIVSVGSFFVSWIVASRLAFLIAPSIPAEEPWNNIGAMIVLFIITLVAVRLAHSYLEKKIKDWQLAKLNRYLGAFLGLVKGLLLCMILTFFGVMVSETTRGIVFNSKSGQYVVQLIVTTGTFIPKDHCEQLHKQFDLFNAQIKGTAVDDENVLSNEMSPEEKLHKMLASIPGTSQNKEALENSETNTKESALGNLISQGGNLLNEARNLQDNLKQESGNAASLFDAIGRWWSGSTKTEPTTEPPKNTNEVEILKNQNEGKISEKTELPITPTIAATNESAIPSLRTSPPVLASPPIFANSPIAPSPTVTEIPTHSDDSLFLHQDSVANNQSTIAVNSAESIPNSSTATATIETLTPLQTNSVTAVRSATPMSIPRSTLSFRLSKHSATHLSATILNTPPTQTSATLFVPNSYQKRNRVEY